MRDDVRREAIRRFRYPKYRRDAPTRAIRTHWRQPELPFAPVDLFFPIIAALAACFGRCDGLGVQDAHGRLRVAIQRLSRQVPQRIIDVDKGSITIPRVEIVSNRTHRRNIVRKHAPLAAGAMVVQQRVDDRAAIDFSRAAAIGRRRGVQQSDDSPLLIGQIG